MHILTILVLAISANADNIAVGLAYGARRIRLPLASNLLIAFITSFGTLITMILGKKMADSWLDERVADHIGSGIIVAVGLYVIVQSFRQPASEVSAKTSVALLPAPSVSSGGMRWLRELVRVIREPELADRDYSGGIDPKEATVLGLALTINNLPTGLAAGTLNLNPLLTTAVVLLFSLLTFWVGIWIGLRYVSRLWGVWAGLIAGAMLVLVGFYEMFD